MKFEIIPSIDIINGKCVRLIQGNYNNIINYRNLDIINLTLKLQSYNIKRLHLVDLDGAKNRKLVNLDILYKISKNTDLIIDFSGGINTISDVETVFNYGAKIVTLGSIIIDNINMFWNICNKYKKKILLSLDVKNYNISIHGWIKNTLINIFNFLDNNIFNRVKNILCTDIYKDGTMLGPNIILYKKLIKRFPYYNIIASGGINCINDIDNLFNIGCKSVVVGRAIYDNRISFKKIYKWMKNKKLC